MFNNISLLFIKVLKYMFCSSVEKTIDMFFGLNYIGIVSDRSFLLILGGL